jgi:hypothetical protein
MASPIKNDWKRVPHTHKNANLIESRNVKDAAVVHVEKGHFRGSTISGYFELADKDTAIKLYKSGKQKLEVKLGWFNAKPPSSWAHITIDSKYKIIDSYSGPVIHNISASLREHK